MRFQVCGLCPLPFENTLRSFGPGLRTWQMASGLAATGHEVRLLAMEIPTAYENAPAVREETYEGVVVERVDDAEFFAPSTVRSRLASERPDAVVGATVYGSFVLARTEPEVPFWADQFGHFMAEAQAKARLEGTNWPLAQFFKHLEPILRTADKISTVSRRQRCAAIGELGLVGRLTAETCGYEFTAVMPCALMPPHEVVTRPMLRPEIVPEDAFVVFWSGGYNVWSDVDTLFQGLEIAMEKDEKIHFVSTGGEISGHDVRTYGDFEARIAGSRFRRRYHLQGWVEAEQVPSFQAEADLGVLTDIPMYEGQLGHKNRIVQWMGAGLPLVYNEIGDLGEELCRHDLALTFAVGDAAGLAEQILRAAADRARLGRMTARARDYAEAHFSIPATTGDLAAWAAAPERAPDADGRRAITSPADFAPTPPTKAPVAAESGVEARAAEAKRQLALIHSSKMWRLWMIYLDIRRAFLGIFRRASN